MNDSIGGTPNKGMLYSEVWIGLAQRLLMRGSVSEGAAYEELRVQRGCSRGAVCIAAIYEGLYVQRGCSGRPGCKCRATCLHCQSFAVIARLCKHVTLIKHWNLRTRKAQH